MNSEESQGVCSQYHESERELTKSNGYVNGVREINETLRLSIYLT